MLNTYKLRLGRKNGEFSQNPATMPKISPTIAKASILMVMALLMSLLLISCAMADSSNRLTRINMTDAQIADAIYIAEGIHSKHPYGVLKTYKRTTPRQACLNTIRHQYKRWIILTGGKGDFIAWLGNVYCPVGCNNDNGTNKYWVNNVKRILNKG